MSGRFSVEELADYDADCCGIVVNLSLEVAILTELSQCVCLSFNGEEFLAFF